jgi:hypothetical protein
MTASTMAPDTRFSRPAKGIRERRHEGGPGN